MKILVSEKLSEHKYKTPEGYLICTDAILARTGKQTYTKDEVFGDGDNTEIDIDRPYDQVMNEKTIASFENKPVTFDHPEEDVNVGNYKSYAVGYVRDVHQGKVDGKDVILGNLVITDQDAINAIESGEHTDLSCGYDCDIKDDGNGGYAQNNIRGNHVALCKEGRAGMARIVDSKMNDANDYSWFKGHINGDLQSYNINSLINNVKSKRQSLHTNLTGKSGNVYTVFIDGSLESNLDEGSNMWIDIIVEKPDGQQKRLVSKKFNSWNECQKIFNDFKNRVRDSKMKDVDSKARDLVDDSKELVVGKWYDFAKKIEVARNQYATSLRISGKSGNVYRYTIYLKNGEMYGSGTYSEIKEKFNIKDSKVDSKVVDQRVKDAEWSNDWANLDDLGIDDRDKKAVEAYFKKLASKYGVSYVRTTYGMYPCPIFRGDKKRLEKLILKEYVGEDRSSAEEEYELIEDSIKDNDIHDSKQTTFVDALKVLNIVDAYKKVKDAITWSEYEKEANKIIDDIIRYAKSIDKQAKVVRKDIKKEGAHTYTFFIVSIKTIKYRELETFIKSKYSTNKFDSRPIYGIYPGYVNEALEVYYMSSYKKKIKDASKDEWVIKNTGLAYEIWNQGRMIKKFPAKKLAIEWIHSRFPTDKIVED